ncbi:MAG TPA: TetR/AcrR family transcriptional regulator [Methanobacteriaceae archaeon]|nr:TetR/AcrR family transcriptional regulator [Methanobacteriaceae archaeon]
MKDETKEKIIDAALNVFCKNGYAGATTRVIAEKAGFNELTLFRKFKTKENLFNTVIEEKLGTLHHTITSLYSDLDGKFDNPEDFLRCLISKLAQMSDDNFEIINIMLRETCPFYEPINDQLVKSLADVIKKNVSNTEVDSTSLAITIYSFIYMRSLTVYNGRSKLDLDLALDKFIDNTLMAFKN